MKKRALAVLLTLAMIVAFACCGGSAFAAKNVSLTIFNSKMEIQSQMEEMAENTPTPMMSMWKFTTPATR